MSIIIISKKKMQNYKRVGGQNDKSPYLNSPFAPKTSLNNPSKMLKNNAVIKSVLFVLQITNHYNMETFYKTIATSLNI